MVVDSNGNGVSVIGCSRVSKCCVNEGTEHPLPSFNDLNFVMKLQFRFTAPL